MTNPTPPVFLHPHEQAALGLAQLLPEAVAQMVARLHGVSLDIGPIKSTTTLGSNEVRKAADMLTTLAAENATLRHDRDVAVVNSDVLRIAMDTLRAERDDLKSAMTPTPDAELDAFVDFMCGAGSFDGAWFGDAHHSLSGHFWWRTRLRKTIATLRASEAAALERAEKLFGMLQTVRDYVSDAASGELKFDKGVSIQDMAASDLKLIDAALTPTADKE